LVLRIRSHARLTDRRSDGTRYVFSSPGNIKADEKGGTLIYSFARPPKVIDNKKTDDPTTDKEAIPLDTKRSDKVVDLDNGLSQRAAKIDHSL
jgi:hypothetical protein